MNRIKDIYGQFTSKIPGGDRGVAIGGTLVAALFVWWMFSDGSEQAVEYQSATLERGYLRSVVSATGTLGALVTVEVGSQLSGQISELHADFNSIVQEGQLIARLDPATFKTRVQQAEAELAIAIAGVAQAGASVTELRAALSEAELNLDRQKKLRERGASSEQQLDTAKAEFDKANARLTSAGAQVVNANAQVKQREASLEAARVDIERTYIRSPVDGVVIGRDIDIGQTVAASLQAPILFTIAQDLSKMQLEVNVDEADIGQIRDGHRVDFSVDAYPRRKFDGIVKQVRKAPIVEQNVVTYTVIVSADNSNQNLLPGMTANVEIVIAEREDVLKIPNRALRFRPSTLSRSQERSGQGQPFNPPGEAIADGRSDASEMTARHVSALSKSLELSAEQTKDLKQESKSWATKAGAERLRRDRPSGLPDVIIANLRSIEDILDEPQRRRFDEILAAHENGLITRTRVWIFENDDEIQMVPISLGISDGDTSELILGDIAPDAKIIVGSTGGSEPSAARVQRRRGPGFF